MLAVGDALAARDHGVDYEWFVDEGVATHSQTVPSGFTAIE